MARPKKASAEASAPETEPRPLAETPSQVEEPAGPVAVAGVEADDLQIADIPTTFTPQAENDGAPMAQVDAGKYVANSCMYDGSQMAHAQQRGWYVVSLGDLGADGKPIVLNENIFQVSREGYLLYGDSVVLICTVAVDAQRKAFDLAQRNQRRLIQTRRAEQAAVPGMPAGDVGTATSITTINLRPLAQ